MDLCFIPSNKANQTVEGNIGLLCSIVVLVVFICTVSI